MEKVQIKHVSYLESSDEWSQEKEEESSSS